MANRGVISLGRGLREIVLIMLIGVVGTWGNLDGSLKGHSATGWPRPQSPHNGRKAPRSILFGQSTFLWGPPQPTHLMFILLGGLNWSLVAV